MKRSYIFWRLFAFLCILVGLYPLLYLLADMKSVGLLSTKSADVVSSPIWTRAFYVHIFLGGWALLIGWTQFVDRIRIRNVAVHRGFGATYIVSVFLSGISGLYIAFYASGGMVAQLGFSGLAISWLITTAMAFRAIKQRVVVDHRRWMIRSYALTFAAVTLRLQIPILQGVFQMEFLDAYQIIAWTCWLPNLMVAQWIINRSDSLTGT